MSLRRSAEREPAAPLAASAVPGFELEAVVVVVGHGAAGGCAAIEAARAGARVLVLERLSRGGGATALSTGLTYFGGGTAGELNLHALLRSAGTFHRGCQLELA